jgi:CubicO group peptidase (beta-lactamase class C family)
MIRPGVPTTKSLMTWARGSLVASLGWAAIGACTSTDQPESGSGTGTDAATTLEEATTSTGDATSTGNEDRCPVFVPTPDPRFDALLDAMRLAAVSPTSRGDDGGLPSGRAVAIVVDGELRHVGGVGTRAKEGHALAGEPVGPDTRFAIASTSKWVHGAMMSSLVEEGLLDFETPVTDVLPEYTESNGMHGTFTLHSLLTMTSGLSRGVGCFLHSMSKDDGPLGCGALSAGPGTVLEHFFAPETLASAPYDSDEINSTVNGAPGVFEYSNWGIMLSGRMAEVVGGAPYPDLVAARVFAPAQMCTATYDPARVLTSEDYTVGAGNNAIYCPEPDLGHDSKAPWEPDELACPVRAANGGIRASAVDMGRFAAAFLADLAGAHVMLAEDMAQRMLCPGGGTHDNGCEGRVATSAPSKTYGYGNYGYTAMGHAIYSHPGDRPGFTSLFLLVPARGFAVVILSNHGDGEESNSQWAAKAVDCWLNDVC